MDQKVYENNTYINDEVDDARRTTKVAPLSSNAVDATIEALPEQSSDVQKK